MADIASYFHGKHVLITGGSSGIGLAMAKRIVAVGGTVTLIARRESVLAEAKATLGGKAHTLSVDIADADAVNSKVGAHIEAHPADMLINNAGWVMPGRFLELESKAIRDMMEINYFGTVHMCRAVLPQMVARKAGHVLNVSSMAGSIGIYGYSAYAASKFALVGFSQCIRAELWPHNVRVSVALPPDTDTPQLAFENQYKPKETKAIAGTVKMMTAEAVAEALLAGMAKGTFEIVPGFDAWSTHVAARMLPGVTRWVVDSAQKKAGASG